MGKAHYKLYCSSNNSQQDAITRCKYECAYAYMHAYTYHIYVKWLLTKRAGLLLYDTRIFEYIMNTIHFYLLLFFFSFSFNFSLVDSKSTLTTYPVLQANKGMELAVT